MAEVQTTTNSGEMAQRFIELVMMQAQNAAFALGQIPHPETGEAPVNLDLARLFIDQLEVLRAKTRGNLSQEETNVLNTAISNLQMAFVEVSAEAGKTDGGEKRVPEAGPAAADEPAGTEKPAPSMGEGTATSEGDSKKKFSKSYGS